AAAWHEHPQFTTKDLLRRAAVYGRVHAQLFRKHPCLISDGKTPFGTLSDADFARMHAHVEEKRAAVDAAIVGLQALDQLDLFELAGKGQISDAEFRDLLAKLSQLVPLVYWNRLFASFLAAWEDERPKSTREVLQREVVGASRL